MTHSEKPDLLLQPNTNKCRAAHQGGRKLRRYLPERPPVHRPSATGRALFYPIAGGSRLSDIERNEQPVEHARAALSGGVAQAPAARPGGQPASGAETGTPQAAALDLETLDLARIHERTLIALVLPSYSARTREAMVRRTGIFFVEAIRPIEQTHRAIRETNVHLNQVNQTLREQVEMVHGHFAVVSVPGQDTTIRAQIPVHNGA